MTVRGVFLKNAITHGQHDDNYWSVMVEDVSEALSASGIPCQPLETTIAALQPAFDAALKGLTPPDFLVLFNLLPELRVGGRCLWHGAKVPVAVPCLDHPVHLAEPLSALLQHWRADPSLPPRMVGVMDPAHRAFLQAMGWPEDAVFAFPQGGPVPVARPKPFARRGTGIVFMGGVRAPLADRDFFAAHDVAEPHLVRAIAAAAEETLAGRDDVMDVALRHLAPLLSNQLQLCRGIALVDTRARGLRRFRLLDSLAGLPVTVYGPMDDGAAALLPHCRAAGSIGFRALLDSLDDTGVVLNDTINLRDSALIRFFYSLSRGCVVASEPNRFTEANFPPGGSVVAVGPERPEGREEIAALLAGEVDTDARITAGMAAYAAAHTWRHRVCELAAAIRRACPG
jgi:hypothetical protein